MFYDPADRDDLGVSILTHCTDGGRISLVRWTSIASPARPGRTRSGCLSAAWNADEKRSNAIQLSRPRSSRCDRRHTRYQATSPIPREQSILLENIVGQSLSVISPSPQTTPFCLPSTPSSGRAPKQSPAPTGASTMPWPNRCPDAHRRPPRRSAQASGQRQNDLAGLAAPIARQTEFAAHAGTHRTPQRGRRSTCLLASSGRCTRTACSRSPVRGGG